MKPQRVQLIMPTQGMETPLLTPTTIRNITQMFESSADNCLEIIDNTTTINLSGTTFSNLDSKGWQGGTTTVVTPSKCIPSMVTLIKNDEEIVEEIKTAENPEEIIKQARRSNRIKSPLDYKALIQVTKDEDEDDEDYQVEKPEKPKRKSTGGRKPNNKRKCGEAFDPEEEERIKVRRLRNKEAAARCRQRRVDVTNTLMAKVDEQEAKKRALEEEIQQLKRAKEDLEFVLQSHTAACTCSALSSSIVTAKKSSAPVLVEQINESEEVKVKMERPTSLTLHDAAQIPLETPTSVISHLAFDAVTTGLTPNAPLNIMSITTPTVLNTPIVSCSTQQRNSASAGASSLEFISL